MTTISIESTRSRFKDLCRMIRLDDSRLEGLRPELDELARILLSVINENPDTTNFFRETLDLHSSTHGYLGTYEDFIKLGLGEEIAKERFVAIKREYPDHARDLALEADGEGGSDKNA